MANEPNPSGIPDDVLRRFIQEVMEEERRYGYERRDSKSERQKVIKDLVLRWAKKLESP
jgi:hypothetical protein